MIKATLISTDKDQTQWGGNDSPDTLVKGHAYEVDHLEVHSMHTKVHLVDFPGKVFNSVQFSFEPRNAVSVACQEYRDRYFGVTR